jgi:uncharacterized protein YndB with AHSA1/START domain
MVHEGLVAEASTTVAAPIARVWEALTDPAMIERYMFGTQVVSTWEAGSPIVWKGEWEGKPYEDRGTILAIEPPHLLRCTHYSPLSGAPDTPENYHTITYQLSEEGGGTRVVLTQDKNADERERAHASEMWGKMLESLRDVVEKER